MNFLLSSIKNKIISDVTILAFLADNTLNNVTSKNNSVISEWDVTKTIKPRFVTIQQGNSIMNVKTRDGQVFIRIYDIKESSNNFDLLQLTEKLIELLHMRTVEHTKNNVTERYFLRLLVEQRVRLDEGLGLKFKELEFSAIIA